MSKPRECSLTDQTLFHRGFRPTELLYIILGKKNHENAQHIDFRGTNDIDSLCSRCRSEEKSLAGAGDAYRKKLALVQTGEEGGAIYSVVSGDTIVVAEEPGLLLIKGGKVCRRIPWQKAISNFDLNRHGNGVIVCDSILYKVKSLVIEPQPIPMSFANYLKGRAAYRVDMIGDTTRQSLD